MNTLGSMAHVRRLRFPKNRDTHMTDTDFSRLRITRTDGVATITINNPPVNVLDVALMGEIRRFLLSVRNDPDTRVLVFQSADPEFFIAHVDMTLIDEPHAFDEIAREAPEGLNPFQAFGELLREQPQVTIVKLAGLARGGGRSLSQRRTWCLLRKGWQGLLNARR